MRLPKHRPSAWRPAVALGVVLLMVLAGAGEAQAQSETPPSPAAQGAAAQGAPAGRRGRARGDFFQYVPEGRAGAKVPTVGPPVETHHQIILNGLTLRYTARVGMMPIRNASTGVVEGYLNYTYYSKDGVSDMQARPITYLFNGGPGAGSLWLHLGAFGPDRIVLPPDGLARPPYTYAPNPDTLLDQSDLVFVDAMGTGWSRPTEPRYGPDFWGVKNDIAAFGAFVRNFSNQYERWGSPIVLAGESYGTTRAAGLAGYLTGHDIPVAGVILISTVINPEAEAGDLQYVNRLPTEAMTAWYHHKAAPDLQKMTAAEVSAAALSFAGHQYLEALYQGARLSPAQRASVLNQLHRFTGLSASYWADNDLRISLGQFSTQLLRPEHEMTSRLDSRFVGYLPDGGTSKTPFDFSEANAEQAFLTAYERYMRDALHYRNDDIYYALGGGIGHWEGAYDTVGELETAFAKNPRLKLMVAMGYYDFATPYGTVEWTLAHLKVSPQVRAHNIMTGHYASGHMIYLDQAALTRLRSDLRRYYTNLTTP